MTNINIIGICGQARSGKDTFANELLLHGYQRISMADPIKEASTLLFGFTNEQLFSDEKDQIDPRYGVKPRHILQRLGTDFCRSYHDDIFIDRMKERIAQHTKVVVPDIRFPNEAKAIKDMGGQIVRIHRTTDILDSTSKGHVSEQLVDTISAGYSIDNIGTLEQYKLKIKEWINIQN